MPVQVQSLVTPVYEAVVTVHATGDIATEAQFIDTAVAILNRVEFVKNLQSDASDSPEAFALVRDDFMAGNTLTAAGVLTADTAWTFDVVGGGTHAVDVIAGDQVNPGRLRFNVAGGNTGAVFKTLGFDSTFDTLTAVAKITNPGGSAGQTVRIGLAQNTIAGAGGNEGLWLEYIPSVNANWLLNRRTLSTDNRTLIKTFTSGQFITFKVIKNTTLGRYDIYVNGLLVTNIAFASMPTGTFQLGAYVTTATDSILVELDLIFCRGAIASRHT